MGPLSLICWRGDAYVRQEMGTLKLSESLLHQQGGKGEQRCLSVHSQPFASHSVQPVLHWFMFTELPCTLWE
jgi:hypothetical protein